MTIKTLAVFCGSNAGHNPAYLKATEQFAILLAKANITVVYGGRTAGLMGVLADHVLDAGGKVIGVIPEKLAARQAPHAHLTQLHVVPSMHERKVLMTELADGFVMLPGGAGSLDEFFEVFTLSQLGYHRKPFGILNSANYFDGLVQFLEHSVVEGFLKKPYKEEIIIENEPELLLKRFFYNL